MLHLSITTKAGRLLACGLVASALVPATSAAYPDARSGHGAAVTSGPAPDVVLRSADTAPAATTRGPSGSAPDVVMQHSRAAAPSAPGTSPDVVLRASGPASAARAAAPASEPGGLDWGSAGVGAAVTAGLMILTLAGFVGVRGGRRAFARP